MVSIVIPCYNCESFVSRAIESVLNQHYTDWELILVNNNSKDKTQKVLDDYQKKYADKIRTYMELKKGGGAARNKGLSEAKGEWIEFLDADDELLPDKLERQLELLKEHNAHLVSSSFFL
ncbi:glycosyltransferase family 2 protein [Dyadobacter sp. NIV53]|uniref:glycosyltransferase family 2 protein n=1 Tax=Dyadobacter sp. NIV53 TaxID=2861765 RepID=UPI001C86DE06|nr:glycosyltransferase family 2 protein [Dyadobacter sp. NIV53]